MIFVCSEVSRAKGGGKGAKEFGPNISIEIFVDVHAKLSQNPHLGAKNLKNIVTVI